MQPKADIKREQKGGPKASSMAITPAEQWDQIAFKLIKDELAPKGYSEIKRGPYRGRVQANIPFLAKGQVERCQKAAAQLVRVFRDKVKTELEGRLKDAEHQSNLAVKDLRDCPFWKFRLRRKHREAYVFYRDHAGMLHILINQLDNISIK